MKITSYLSPKVKRISESKIAGNGLLCIEPITKGELVAIKGGHIIGLKTFEEQFEPVVGMSILQINEHFVIGPTSKEEVHDSVIYLNHSCDPNVGLRGEITFVAMKNIESGKEITTDYAMIQDNDDKPMQCNCGAIDCRKVITGKDWQDKNLQGKYGKYFSAFLREKFEG